MAYKQLSPRGVSEGGTGKQTFVAYAVLCTGATAQGALQQVSGLGSSGEVLTSAGSGSLPTWETAPTNDTFVQFQVVDSAPSSPSDGDVWFTSNSFQGRAEVFVNAWASGGSLSSGTRSLAAAGVSNTDSMSFGGADSGGSVAATQTYNGTSWSSVNALNTGRSSLCGAGTTSDALSAGGFDDLTTTERWDGVNWTAKTGLSTGRDGPPGAAGTDGGDVLVFGGAAGAVLSSTELYDGVGDSWSGRGSLNTARAGVAGSGNSSAALSYGGTTGSVSAVTELYDSGGNSWSAKASMSVARSTLGGAGYNTTSAALSFGGNTGSVSDVTERYFLTGDTWITVDTLSSARANVGGSGTAESALTMGGFISPTNQTVTEEFDGTSSSTTVTFTVT